MLQTKKKTIGGHEYSVTQFLATEAIKISRTLKDELGVSFAQGITGVLASGDGTVILSTIIRELCKGLDEDGTVKMVKRMLEQSGARCDGQEILPQFDIMFAGKLKTLFVLLAFILEVNYGDFLGEDGTGNLMDTLIEVLQDLKESVSPSKESKSD